MAEFGLDPGGGGAGGNTGGGLDTGAPPKIPAKTKAQKSAARIFTQYVKHHAAIRPYAGTIAKWAAVYGVDPTYLAALIMGESSGDPNAESSAHALGLAQIHMPTWAGKKTPWGETITREWAVQPGNAVRFAAWYFGRQLHKYGDYNTAYAKGYNPGYQGNFFDQAGIAPPKGYVPVAKGLSPQEEVSVSAEKQSYKAFQDPYVKGVNGKGNLVFTDNPNKAMKWDNAPVRESEFMRGKRELESYFVSWTGKRPNNFQIRNFMVKGWSTYTLEVSLSKSPNFKNSPIYKQRAPVYQEAAKDLLAPGEKLDPELIRKGALYNWDATTVQAEIRKRPTYIQSVEFKGRSASMMNIYESIYGHAGTKEQATVARATLAGWGPDQFAAWLRSQKNYAYTPEYREKAVRLVEELGMLTGKTAVLKPTDAPPPPSPEPGGYGPLPEDTRITHEAGLPTGPGLVPGAI